MADLGALARVPFLGGYLAQGEANRAEQAGNQDQQMKSLAMLAQMQRLKQENDIRTTMANSPDPTSAIPALVKLGPHGVAAATSLANLAQQQTAASQAQKKADFFSPQNQQNFMDTVTTPPANPVGEMGPNPPVTSQQLNINKMMAAGAAQNVIPPEAYLNHQAQREQARAQLAATISNRKDALETRLYDIQTRSQDRGLDREARAQATADANSIRLQIAQLAHSLSQVKSPSGYEPNPDKPGTLRPIVGGPADPNNLKAQAKAEDKNKAVSGMADDIDTLIGMLQADPNIAGGRGFISRGMEAVSGAINPTEAPSNAHLFESRITDLKTRMQLLQSNKRFSKVTQDAMNRVIQGTGLGQNAASSIATLSDMKDKILRDSGASASSDQFVTGKKYKDASGNTATYLGDGKWGD